MNSHLLVFVKTCRRNSVIHFPSNAISLPPPSATQSHAGIHVKSVTTLLMMSLLQHTFNSQKHELKCQLPNLKQVLIPQQFLFITVHRLIKIRSSGQIARR